MGKVIRLTEGQLKKVIEKIINKKIINEKRDYPISREVSDYPSMKKYGSGTKWAPAGRTGEKYFNYYYENFGPFTIYISPDDKIKIGCIGGECYDQDDYKISREEAARRLGVDSLEQITKEGIK